MSVFEIPQRLLGGGPFFPVRLDRIAKFGQRRLSGQGQMRGVIVGFPGQQFGNRIGRRRGDLGCGRRPRRRKSRGGLRGRGRGVVFRACGLWRGSAEAGAGAAAGGFGGENPNSGAG